jgi:FkbM family methyltransferase
MPADWRTWPVIKRLRPSVLRRWARLRHPDGAMLARYFETRFLLDHRNYVDRQVGLLGGFERAQIAALLADLRAMDCDAFLDVGANFGLYALIVARHGLAREVVAVEPDPRSRLQLDANRWLNRDAPVPVAALDKAASDRSATLAFAAAHDSSTGRSHVAAQGAGNSTVEAVALDQVYAWRGRRLAIKLDVERHEAAALRGMEGLLTGNACLLQVEIDDVDLPQLGGWLQARGYRLVRQDGIDRVFRNFA